MAVNITICTGQICGRTNSRELLHLARKLDREHPGCLHVTTQHCFARCQVNDGELCPSIRIDGEWMNEATTARMRSILMPMIARLEAELDNPDDPFAKLLRSLG